ncbi:hypothetical protein CIG19_17875 [Enterobacterales bacterium CwR94]|nr:hypothetical protein CIG19_17875 [Enterobacterales bacterium CwR94]
MSQLNTCIGRYCLKASDQGGLIRGSIAINGEGGSVQSQQQFAVHYMNDVLNNVVYPVTGGNRQITDDFRKKMQAAGFEQPH